MTDVYKFITIAIFIVISVLESIRLYLGYLGNLAEKVVYLNFKLDWLKIGINIKNIYISTQIPELASFWLISTLIHFPLEMVLLFDSQTKSHVSETVANGIMMFLLVTEIVTATIALRNSANHHAKRFYVAQLYGIDDSIH